MTLLEGGPGLATYIALKLGGYALWSYVGVRWLGHRGGKPVRSALALGVARLLLGWGAGILVAPFVLAAGAERLPLFYFAGLPVVRWLEWGVLQCVIPGAAASPAVLLGGGSPRGRAWRAIGVVVSYLADAPFLLTSGFPRGRILC